MNESLSPQERAVLLKIARQAMESAVRGERLPAIVLDELSPRLRQPGASFVTLTRRGQLRGCIGALEPQQPLALDVRDHAIAAALQDYRFPPVQPSELEDIRIEVSVLTLPQDLEYETPQDLLRALRPGVDGVILMDGGLLFCHRSGRNCPTRKFSSTTCAKKWAQRRIYGARKN